jgi:hypothetical protein
LGFTGASWKEIFMGLSTLTIEEQMTARDQRLAQKKVF